MRIAFVNQPWSRVFPPVEHADSIAIWTSEVAARLAGSFQVAWYNRRLRGQPAIAEHAGVEYRRITPPPEPPGLDLMKRVWRKLRLPEVRFGSILHRLPYSLRIAADLRRRGCDIVHIHNFSQFVTVVRRLNPDARIVLHMHCEWLSQLPEALIRPRLEAVDQVVGCSDHVTNAVRRRYPDLANRCRTIPNGVGDAFVPPDREQARAESGAALRVIYVGRLSPEKGLHVLIDAFQLCAKDFPAAVLDIIGPQSGTPPEFLVDLSADPNVRGLRSFYRRDYLTQLRERVRPEFRDRIRFVGEVPRTELPARFWDAAVLANPSLSEAFGMSLIEAMVAGVPVLATDVGGMPEIVSQGRMGILVPPNDPAELARGMSRLLADAALRQTLGASGQARWRQLYSWDRIAAQVEACFRGLGRASARAEGGAA